MTTRAITFLLVVMALVACTSPPKVQDDSPDACIVFCLVNHINVKVK